MTDVFTRKKRSLIMAAIHADKNKETEIALINIFKEFGIKGWRRKSKIIGKPDFIFPNRKLAIFVDGCFWHKCPYHYILPKTNIDYWSTKIARNKKRDKKVNKELTKINWTIIRIWQHQLKSKEHVANKIKLKLCELSRNN